MRVFNTALAGNFLNWPKVWLMAFIAFFAFYLIAQGFNKKQVEE